MKRIALSLLCLLVPTLVCSAAQAQSRKEVAREQLIGTDHEIAVPAGWSYNKVSDNGIEFAPPKGAAKHEPFACRLVAVKLEASAGPVDATQLAGSLADDDKQNLHPAWERTDINDATLGGFPGAMLMLHGPDDRGIKRAILYVLGIGGGVAYYLRVEASYEDLSAAAADMDIIIGGFRRLGGSAPTPKSPGKAGFGPGGARPEPARPEHSQATVTLRDPLWGLAVVKPSGGWELLFEDKGYVLRSLDEPYATATFTRQPIRKGRRKRFEKKLLKKSGAARLKFAGRPAIVVEGKNKNGQQFTDYYLLQEGGAVVLSLSASGDYAAARRVRIPQLEAAIAMTEPSALAATGTKARLFGGVGIAVGKRWKLRSSSADRVLHFSKARTDVVVSVEVFSQESARAWKETLSMTKTKCSRAGGKLAQAEIPGILHAKKSVRYQCNYEDFGDVVTLTEGTFNGDPVFVKTITQHEWGQGEGAPLAETAEFLMFLSFSK